MKPDLKKTVALWIVLTALFCVGSWIGIAELREGEGASSQPFRQIISPLPDR